MKLWMMIGAAVIVVAAVGYFVMGSKKPDSSVKVEMMETPKVDWPTSQAAYLVENIKKPGWQATASGIQYTVLNAGDGKGAKPTPGTEVTVHYEGRLTTGEVFDSSYARNEPMTFPLNGVIPGWQEGVPLMRVGDTWDFVIPANLAYGARGVGPIPGGSTLLFKIELLAAKTPIP